MPAQARDIREYHIFLASPGDVNAERQAVRAFFEEFNITTAGHWGVRFTVVDWENYATVGVGRPQELITEQTLKTYKDSLALVIGLMGQRFGTPSGAAESGTEEEFEWALAHWRQHQRPEIKWYFRKIDRFEAPASPDEIQAALGQWERVRAFRRRLDEGEPRVFAGEYANAAAFPEVLRRDLRLWLEDPQRQWAAKPEPTPDAGKPEAPAAAEPNGNGAWLIRAAVYLAIFAAVAFGTWHEWDDLERLHAALPVGMLLLPALAIAFGELGPGWKARERRKELHRRGARGGTTQPGYFRLRPYEDGEALTRADGAHLETLHWIQRAKAPLLFLTGVSGAGKSSLLNASVLPGLRAEGWTVVAARSFGDPTEQLVSALLEPDRIWKKPPGDADDPRALLERAAKRSGRLLVVLDQFEEFLILHEESSAERERLTRLLESITAEPIAGLTVLCVFRSDYKGAYMQTGLPPLAQDGNWEEIAAFYLPAARRFLEDSGMQIDADLLERVIDEATAVEETKGLIRPITLNMFGLVLQRYGGRLPEDVAPGRLLRSYLEEAIGRGDLRETAPGLLRPMLTDAGTKRPRTVEELSLESGAPATQARGCLLGLEEQGLVRRLDRAGTTWEISHDFLARMLGPILAGWREKLWRRARPALAPAALAVGLAALVWGPVAQWAMANGALAELNNLYCPARLEPDKGYEVNCTDAIELEKALLLLHQLPQELHLDLSGTEVTDLSPLQGLSSLASLDLSVTEVTDLSPLQGLSSLTSLSLSSTEVTDLSPLQGLSSLTSLKLWGTGVTDLSPLQGLSSLTSLSLLGTEVTDREIEQLKQAKSDLQIIRLR
ncbi:MAG: hypothetical protein GC160_28315 [Acidobacteria bacterium]|nr:hypothetical protein [Acidobacteriota bacterium]